MLKRLFLPSIVFLVFAIAGCKKGGGGGTPPPPPLQKNPLLFLLTRTLDLPVQFQRLIIIPIR